MSDSASTIRAEVWSRLPESLYLGGRRSGWVAANKAGAIVNSFLEGPAMGQDGALWLTDIPYGRILRVDPAGTWSVAAEYEGWPNGMRRCPGGGFMIADHKRGILRFDPDTGAVAPVFETHRSEGFKGCNDLWFAEDGTLFFTDQGQTGLHDPTGRVFRADPALKTLAPLIGNGPSPNGLVTSLDDRFLYVAMTRSCEVWRLPLFADGTSKVNLFARLPPGISGPDGMALDRDGNLYVCHAGRGAVFVYDMFGDHRATIDCRHIGRTVTNLVFRARGSTDLLITVSDTGAVAVASALAAGR